MKQNVWKSGLAALTLSAALIGCDQSQKTTDNEDAKADSTAINVVPVADSKQFPGAELKIASITSEKVGNDSAKVTVKYDVANFTLTEHTEDHNAHHLANSSDGQHIHFILDNTPYIALYKPENSVTVAINSEHYLLSFLSRSYHESIKEPEAAKLVKFKIDENGAYEELPAPTEPSLFYSRPKGAYTGADTENVLLDFYIWNTTLSSAGTKVKAEINGDPFTLDHWGPYEIQNAPKGDLKVKLTLVDQDGNALSGDNVSIEQTVKLSE